MGVVIVHTDHIRGSKYRRELLFEVLAVIGSDTEGTNRSYVAEHRVFNLIGELRDKLVCHRKRELVFACLGEDGRDRRSDEVLELIDMEVEGRQVLTERVRAGERRDEKFADDDKPQEVGVEVANAAFGEVDQQDLAVVHQVAKVKSGMLLGYHRTHEIVGRKDVELICYIRSIVLESLFTGRFGSDALPKLLDDRVFARGQFTCPKIGVRKYSRDI